MTRRRRGQSLREGSPAHRSYVDDGPEGLRQRATSSVAGMRAPSWSAWTLGRWPGWGGSAAEAPTRQTSPVSSTDATLPSARATRRCLRVTSLPACSAEALHLGFAREDPAAVQAEELPGALGPPIARGRRRRALEVHHLSMIRNAVGAHPYRVGAKGACGTHRRHGVSLSRGHGARG